MSVNLSDTNPTKARLKESAIIGLWEVNQISTSQEKTDPMVVSQRTQLQFLEEMIYIRIKDGVSTHGNWQLFETNDDKVHHVIVLNDTVELQIISLEFDELILSDGLIDYKLVRRI